jgi:hypothetical protein
LEAAGIVKEFQHPMWEHLQINKTKNLNKKLLHIIIAVQSFSLKAISQPGFYIVEFSKGN